MPIQGRRIPESGMNLANNFKHLRTSVCAHTSHLVADLHGRKVLHQQPAPFITGAIARRIGEWHQRGELRGKQAIEPHFPAKAIQLQRNFPAARIITINLENQR